MLLLTRNFEANQGIGDFNPYPKVFSLFVTKHNFR